MVFIHITRALLGACEPKLDLWWHRRGPGSDTLASAGPSQLWGLSGSKLSRDLGPFNLQINSILGPFGLQINPFLGPFSFEINPALGLFGFQIKPSFGSFQALN